MLTQGAGRYRGVRIDRMLERRWLGRRSWGWRGCLGHVRRRGVTRSRYRSICRVGVSIVIGKMNIVCGKSRGRGKIVMDIRIRGGLGHL